MFSGNEGLEDRLLGKLIIGIKDLKVQKSLIERDK